MVKGDDFSEDEYEDFDSDTDEVEFGANLERKKEEDKKALAKKYELLKNFYDEAKQSKNKQTFAFVNTESKSLFDAQKHKDILRDLPMFTSIGSNRIGHDYFPLSKGNNKILKYSAQNGSKPKRFNQLNFDVTSYSDYKINADTILTLISLSG